MASTPQVSMGAAQQTHDDLIPPNSRELGVASSSHPSTYYEISQKGNIYRLRARTYKRGGDDKLIRLEGSYARTSRQIHTFRTREGADEYRAALRARSARSTL
jgi:hypothetical protein